MADNANKEIKTATADDGSTGYEMKIGLGTIAMLISATGMGLGAPVQPLGNSYGHVRRGAGSERWRLHRCFDGRGPHEHGRAVLRRHHVRYGQGRDVQETQADAGHRVGRLDDRHVAGVLRDVYAVDHHLERCSVHLHRSCRLRSARAHLPQGTHVCFTVGMPGCGVHRHVVRQQPDGFQRVWLLRRLQPGSVYA